MHRIQKEKVTQNLSAHLESDREIQGRCKEDNYWFLVIFKSYFILAFVDTTIRNLQSSYVQLLVIIEPGTIHRVVLSHQTLALNSLNSELWTILDFARNSGTNPQLWMGSELTPISPSLLNGHYALPIYIGAGFQQFLITPMNNDM